jgi:hypothetical protein
MRHDCQTTEESLVELLFGEVEGGARGALLEEVVRCERCAARYRSMAETLRVFDEAAETSLPVESFWDGYEERLRRRMAQEIRTDFWGRPSAGFARGEQWIFTEGLTTNERVRNVWDGRAMFGGTSKRINFKGMLTLNPARDADDGRVDWLAPKQ